VDAKPLLWVGSAREDLRRLPAAVRKELGTDLRRVQNGLVPRDWRPMGTVGFGVVEIRVRVQGAYRLMYIAKFAEGIYVLYVFQKKSQKTSGLDLDVARTRYAAVSRARREG
jgi:phage-related protein